MPKPPLIPPKQARSRRTLDRLVHAALALIAEHGVDALTVVDVVEHAGSSVGSFYARFAGKEELLVFLEERVRQDGEVEWSEAVRGVEWEALTLQETAEAIVRILLAGCREDAECRNAIRERAGAAGHTVPSDPLHSRRLADLRRILLARGEETAHPAFETTLRFGYALLIGGIREIVDWERTADELLSGVDDRHLVSKLASGFVFALRVPDHAQDGGSPSVSPFDVWV